MRFREGREAPMSGGLIQEAEHDLELGELHSEHEGRASLQHDRRPLLQLLSSSQNKSRTSLSSSLALRDRVHGRLEEGTMPLVDFIRWTQYDSGDGGIASLPIDKVQFRQCKRLPFRHEYVVLYVHQDGINWVIRLERAGKVDKLTFNKWGMPRLRGSAKDTVRVVRKDSPEADAVIKDKDSKGSIILREFTFWTRELPKRIDASLLLACWIPATKRFHARLDEAFLPEYPTMGIPPKMIPWFVRNAEMQRVHRGMVFADPRTVIVTELASRRHYGYKRYYRELIFHRLRRQFSTPIFVSRKMHDRVIVTRRDLEKEYFRDVTTLYNRLRGEDDPPTWDDDEDVVYSLASLPYSAARLSDLITPLNDLYDAWPNYSLYTTNCDMFSRVIRNQDVWAGYDVTRSRRGVAPQSRLRDGLHLLLLRLMFFVIFLLVVMILLLILVAAAHVVIPFKPLEISIIAVMGPTVVISLVSCNIFYIQYREEDRVNALLEAQTRYLPEKQVDLDWTRPEVLFRRKEKREVIKRRHSVADFRCATISYARSDGGDVEDAPIQRRRSLSSLKASPALGPALPFNPRMNSSSVWSVNQT